MNSAVACLDPISEKTVRCEARHERRALTADELRALLTATENAPFRFGMTGHQRMLLYRLALETGLRASELGVLTRGSFEFSPRGAKVSVKAEDTKNGKGAEIPLRSDSAALLSEYLADKLPAAKAFNTPKTWDFASLLREDLEAAGIAYKDAQNRCADFHALRHTFVTNLANSGVHPKVAQDLARHSDINLTLSRYSHTVLEQRSEAVAKLPALDIKECRGMKTGTDNVNLSCRNETDFGKVSADSDGRSSYEKQLAILAQLVEQRFCKP